MTKLSKYFSRHEIACNCGCGLDSMDKETLDVADEAREFVSHSISPSSSARCYKYNRSAEVGSNDNSQHPRCRAMDLPTTKAKELFEYLCSERNRLAEISAEFLPLANALTISNSVFVKCMHHLK